MLGWLDRIRNRTNILAVKPTLQQSTMSAIQTPLAEAKASAPSLHDHKHHNPEKPEPSTDTATDEEAATTPAERKQKWNESPTNIYRYLSTIYSFILLGMTDAVIGALLPYVSLQPAIPKHGTANNPRLKHIMTSLTPSSHSSFYRPLSATSLPLSSTTTSVCPTTPF